MAADNQRTEARKARFLSVVLSSLALLVLLTATGLSTYAWMAQNLHNTSKNHQMSLEADDTMATYTIYWHDPALGENGVGAGTTTYLPTDGTERVPVDIGAIDFNPYDLIFLARNRYTPIFARIQVVKLESTPDAGQITITLTHDTDKDTDLETGVAAGSLSTYVSSILRFTALVDTSFDAECAAMSEAEFYDHVDGLLYNKTKTYTGSEAHNVGGDYTDASGTFFSAFSSTGSGINTTYDHTKQETLTLTVKYTADDWDGTDAEGNEVLNIYLYMTYDADLIECYKAEHNMAAISIGKNIIDFENDLVELRVSTASGD